MDEQPNVLHRLPARRHPVHAGVAHIHADRRKRNAVRLHLVLHQLAGHPHQRLPVLLLLRRAVRAHQDEDLVRVPQRFVFFMSGFHVEFVVL